MHGRGRSEDARPSQAARPDPPCAVTDLDNHLIGYVRDLLIDEADWKVRFPHVTVGGHLVIGDRHYPIPVEAVERVSGGFVTIEQSREQIPASP